MPPMTEIVFHWVEKQGKKQVRKKLTTNYCFFKQYAIELLEDERKEKVWNVYYTLNNLTTKLDYFNEVLLCPTVKDINL